jgi:hypothetical protein
MPRTGNNLLMRNKVNIWRLEKKKKDAIWSSEVPFKPPHQTLRDLETRPMVTFLRKGNSPGLRKKVGTTVLGYRKDSSRTKLTTG